jgi:hypothetical protein
MLVFIQKKVRLRLLIFFDMPIIYLHIRRHILTLINLILVFLCFFLFHAFEGICFYEVFSGLPSITKIKHQIDLMPRVTIPNQPAYISDLDETKEL